MSEKIETEEEFIRVAARYYLLSEMPLTNGDVVKRIIPWLKDAIKDDYGKDLLGKIKKYHGFVCVPDNVNHIRKVGYYYNIYYPLEHKLVEGDWSTIKVFLEHIFGEQLDIGLDYLTILFKIPIQKLPILCLVSSQRSTGKTTFLKFLKAIYNYNLVFISNDLLNGRFNSFLDGKLLAVLDEGLLNTKEVTEKLKNLSTADFISLEAKGRDPVEVETFTKIIICSNNEDNFIVVDDQSERFWVRKINPILQEDTNILDKMKSEIPAFLYFLNTRKFSYPKQTRIWFTKTQLKTKALDRLIANNRSKIERDIVGKLITILEDEGLDLVSFCVKDLIAILPNKYSDNEIRKVLKNKWELRPENNSMPYQKFSISSYGDIAFVDAKGRYYTIKREFLEENFDDLMM